MMFDNAVFGEIEYNVWNDFTFNNPFEGEAVKEINGVKLPGDYLEFMKQHNGGEGDTGNVWVIFFRMEELTEINEDYSVEEYLPDSCIIGSNGGGELLGVDTKGNYFTVPAIIDEGDKVILGNYLQEFIVNLNKFFGG